MLLTVDSRAVSAAFLAAILGVDFLGPASYLGVDEDAVVWSLLGLFLLFVLARQSVGRGSTVEATAGGEPRVGEHYRLAGHAGPGADGVAGAVYRVVGTGEVVTLLRVTDGDGRRIHAGELRRVDPAELGDAFEPATDPDVGFTPVAGLGNVLSGLY